MELLTADHRLARKFTADPLCPLCSTLIASLLFPWLPLCHLSLFNLLSLLKYLLLSVPICMAWSLPWDFIPTAILLSRCCWSRKWVIHEDVPQRAWTCLQGNWMTPDMMEICRNGSVLLRNMEVVGIVIFVPWSYNPISGSFYSLGKEPHCGRGCGLLKNRLRIGQLTFASQASNTPK